MAWRASSAESLVRCQRRRRRRREGVHQQSQLLRATRRGNRRQGAAPVVVAPVRGRGMMMEPVAAATAPETAGGVGAAAAWPVGAAADQVANWADCELLRFTTRMCDGASAREDLARLESQYGLAPACVLACLHRALVRCTPGAHADSDGPDGAVSLLYPRLTMESASRMRAVSTVWRSHVRQGALDSSRRLRRSDGSARALGGSGGVAGIIQQMLDGVLDACDMIEVASIANEAVLDRMQHEQRCQIQRLAFQVEEVVVSTFSRVEGRTPSEAA